VAEYKLTIRHLRNVTVFKYTRQCAKHVEKCEQNRIRWQADFEGITSLNLLFTLKKEYERVGVMLALQRRNIKKKNVKPNNR
jgi:hypothetical protein